MKYDKKGILILFVVGTLFHYIYDITGNLKLIGAIVPVNESVWEHSKLILIPMIIWWVLRYYFKFYNFKVDKDKWFTGAIFAVISAIITMISFYYTYSGALGFESLPLDIFDLFLSIIVGQNLGLHIYKYGKGINFYTSLIILIFLVFIFALFTFYPPKLPIFYDNLNEIFGIYNK